MEQHIKSNYTEAIKTIKQAILKSRYRAAALANKELLALYFSVGCYVSLNTRNKNWGTGAIEEISNRLQQELPGLRGFSSVNVKRMRQFYEAWESYMQPANNQVDIIRPLSTDELQIDLFSEIRQLTTGDLSINMNSFLSIGFTHHYELLLKTTSLAERLFYIERCAIEFWSVEKLKYNIASDLYKKQGTMPNNFTATIPDTDLQRKALLSFKDEYLLDYINVESSDDDIDERVLEREIVINIKNFIMSLGKDFSFIGNQYRLIVEEQEYFIDLLFFNRQLQCLVAIELKRGGFKPEYAGKMNFYLSALDDLVRLPHENRSVGIILCKSQKQGIVEYAFRDTSKPMGVATYKLATELPDEYKDILPDAEKLRELL